MPFPVKSTNNRHPAYQAWISLRYRCNNPEGKNSCYKGISYDKSWESFDNFWNDMGESWKPKLTIDRIDSKKDYCKENCRWVDKYVQANNKSNNRKLSLKGLTMNISQWARKTGINRTTIRMRIDEYGWSVEEALTKKARI